MFDHETSYLYIQSRFYRAPEVILGGSYSYPIDMWSFGCLIAELYIGEPLFAGNNEQEQLSLIMQVIGTPSKEYLHVHD
jgi:dual specificity tyrosine-phosphorylation-regulated kinase 2/3/4